MDHSRKNFSDFFSIAVIIAVILCFIFMNDTGTTAALRWLAVVFAVSLFLRPFLVLQNLRFSDNGFGISFALGLILCFFPAWTICAVTKIPYSDPVIFTSFAVMSVIGFFIRKYATKEPYITKKEIIDHLKGFAAFAVIFLAFFWMIGFNPLVDPGTENYMDFGFLQTIYRQKSAIPVDPWFSGTTLNYYYLGQMITVFITRLSLTTPEFGYNMMLATFIGMVFVMVFEIVSGASRCLFGDLLKKDSLADLGGTLGAFAAAFCANPHWLLYGIFGTVISRLFGSGDYRYWFPDGTVYINMDNGDPDNGKNEFPAYSVILGDLHAHVINVLFVLPLVAILFDLCMGEKEESKKSMLYRLSLISLLLAYFKGANYWDFAIYFVITGAVIVFFDLKRRGFSLRTFAVIASKAVFVTAVSIIAILPFTINFIKMESGIELCENHTPPVKLAVLWLLPFAVTIMLIVWLYKKKTAEDGINVCARSSLLAFMLCTMGLVITPEVIYIKDIYGEANLRFNTMFKLTYQAYILFAIIIGLAFTYVLGRRMRTLAAVAVVLTALSCIYTPYSAYRWFGNYADASLRKGISSLEGLRTDPVYYHEMEAYDILMQDDKRVLNIVEMSGDSYRHTSSLSVYTGACTPLGWYVHEWMWHNEPEPVQERATDVAAFYCSGDKEYCNDFLKRYDIDYIWVGPAEVCKYPVNRNGFWNCGEVVLDRIWQDSELALIKVDKSRL